MRFRAVLSAVLATTTVALLGAASAEARTGSDPCRSADPSLSESGYQSSFACGARFDIPPHRTWTDPTNYDAPGVGCPDGWRITHSYAPTPRGPMTSEGDWDYWTLRSEWVAWDGVVHWVNAVGVPGLRALRPRYHNWGSWDWPTQTHFTCSPGKGPVVYKVAQADDAPQAEDAAPNVEDGTPGDDREAGTKGDDVLLGEGGDDTQRGGAGDDNALGGQGTDTLDGGTGDDTLQGGPGNDHAAGGAGDDQVFDDQGRDTLSGGPGNDRFSARDGNRDVIDCGSGDDIAIGDPKDVYRDCEHVYRSAADDPARPPRVS